MLLLLQNSNFCLCEVSKSPVRVGGGGLSSCVMTDAAVLQPCTERIACQLAAHLELDDCPCGMIKRPLGAVYTWVVSNDCLLLRVASDI